MTIKEFFATIEKRYDDFHYSPFVSSYAFFFIFWNAKMILILISGEYTLYDKIDELSYNDINYEYPFASAIVYTFALPILTIVAYAATEFFNSGKTFIKVFAEGKTPLTLKEDNELRASKREMSTKLNEMEDELLNIRIKYKEKEAKLIANISEKEANIDSTIEAKTNDLQTQLDVICDERDKAIENLKSVTKLRKKEEYPSHAQSPEEEGHEMALAYNLSPLQSNILYSLLNDPTTTISSIKKNTLQNLNISADIFDSNFKHLDAIGTIHIEGNYAYITERGKEVLKHILNT